MKLILLAGFSGNELTNYTGLIGKKSCKKQKKKDILKKKLLSIMRKTKKL